MSANFQPEVYPYKETGSFRFWCQKVLPLVYDDSLSYYELLCKVVKYLNDVIANVDGLHDDVLSTNQAFYELQEYVNNYFANLDVQEEINNKLDAMVVDGTLGSLIEPFLSAYEEEIDSIVGVQNTNISNQNERITVLEGRMNEFSTLTEGSTTGDAELADIRVPASGFNGGENYANSGDAVRGQSKALLDCVNGNYSVLANKHGYCVKTDGTEDTSAATRCTGFIPTDDILGVFMSTVAGEYTLTPLFDCYDSSKTFVKAIKTDTTGGVYDEESGTFLYMFSLDELSQIKYIRLNVTNYEADDAIRMIQFIRLGLLKAVGNANVLTVAEDGNLNSDNADAYQLEPNKVYYRYSTGNSPSNLPYTGWTGNIICLQGKPGTVSGKALIAISLRGDMHINASIGIPESYSGWKKITNESDVKGVLGYVGSYTGIMTSQTPLATGIVLRQNVRYIVFKNKAISKNINVYGYGDNANFKYLMAYRDFCVFTPVGSDRQLYLYGDYSGDVDISVYEFDSLFARGYLGINEYVVNNSNANFGDFTSITDCFLALKDDNTNKKVIIHGGDYNIYNEYVSANVPVYTGDSPATEYYDYCVWVPNNTHVIGMGRVRMIWQPNPSNVSITWKQCYAVSPLNVGGNAIIENIEIHCKNGRYCIHNDTMNIDGFANLVQKFIGVRCYKYVSDVDTTTTPGESHVYGTRHVIGYGCGYGQRKEYHDCLFVNLDNGRAFYGHTNTQYYGYNIPVANSGQITLDNCVLKTAGSECVKLGNTGSQVRDVLTRFNNCYFSGLINIINESGSGDALPNAYRVIFLNCGEVSVHVADTNNPYPLEGYGTVITAV